jgi:hypothetical protein
MRNLVLLIVMALAAAAGWWGGSWSGRTAKEGLARAEKAGELLKAEHEKESAALKAKVDTLAADFDRDKQALAADHARQTGALNAVIAGSKSQVAVIDQARKGTQAELARLQSALAAATTPQEKQTLQRAITVQQDAQTQQTTQIAGLQCLDVPVPATVLASWRGVQP